LRGLVGSQGAERSHMRGKIPLIPNQIFPIALLPDATFATALPDRRYSFFVGNGFGKPHFDQPPA